MFRIRIARQEVDRIAAKGRVGHGGFAKLHETCPRHPSAAVEADPEHVSDAVIDRGALVGETSCSR